MAVEKAKKPAADKSEAQTPAQPAPWTVLCENARPTPSNPTGHQEHLTRDGTPYLLHFREPTAMPTRHAVDFLVDEAFHVLDENGVRQYPLRQATAGAISLRQGEYITTLAELSDQAILIRARRVNPLASKELGRAELIRIIERGSDAPAGAVPAAATDGEDLAVMEDE